MNQLSNSQCNSTGTQGKPPPTTVWSALQFKRNTKTDWLLCASMVFMQSVSRLLSRLSRLRFFYRMLWRYACLLQLFLKVVPETGLTEDDSILHRMKQSDSRILVLRNGVSELRLELVSQDKVTELRVMFL